MDENQLYNRQLDLIKPQELNFPIAIIGAGGIGSWATLALAKLGCQDLTVYDFDFVEAENTPSQFYTPTQIGTKKVDALAENITKAVGMQITALPFVWQDIQRERELTDTIIISAVDSMEQRIDIWHLLQLKINSGQLPAYYIDARMGGELLNINVVNFWNLESMDYYARTLLPSSQIAAELCTAKAVVYNTFFIGGMLAAIVKKIAKKESLKYDYSFDIAQLTSI
jgi:hypothetical protein